MTGGLSRMERVPRRSAAVGIRAYLDCATVGPDSMSFRDSLAEVVG